MARKLSKAQRQVLENIRDGRNAFHGCYGASQWGGWSNTYDSLWRHGWIRNVGQPGSEIEITDAGHAALGNGGTNV